MRNATLTGAVFQLHKAFQEQYENLFEAVDEIAERVRALDAFAIGGLNTLARTAGMEELKSLMPQKDYVAALIVAHEKVVDDSVRVRDGSCETNDLQDAGLDDQAAGIPREDAVDAQELPALMNAAPSVDTTNHRSFPTARQCTASRCRRRCALEVIDDLLRQDRAVIRGEEADLLLDLRWQLRQRTEPETALRIFCELRRRMEQRHYLAFFRIKRWLENHVVVVARACSVGPAHEVPVRLDHYCVEAIRRMRLCVCLGRGTVLLAPRMGFAFRPLGGPTPAANFPARSLRLGG